MTGRRRLQLWILMGLAALALPGAAQAAAGDLDTSFSGDGKLTTAFGTTPFHAADTGNGAARLANGDVYVAGTTPSAGDDNDFALVRFTSEGVLDSTFGGGDGIVITDLSGSGSDDLGTAVSVNTNTGNVVVAGTTSVDSSSDDDDFALARYTSAGALDSTFGGGDGIVITDIAAGDADSGNAVAHVDPTSSTSNIIIAGTTEDIDTQAEDFAVAAYTSTGALDTNFDGDGGSGNGKVTTDFGSASDFVQAIRITAGPEILVAGGTDPAGDDRGDFALARYSASTGELDDTTTSFDTDGKQTVSFSPNTGGSGNGDNATALTTDGSGRIVVAGVAGPGNGDFGVARLDAAGALDNTLDGDGKQTVTSPASGPTINSSDQLFAVAVQGDGKILLAGGESGSRQWMLARMSDTGVADAGFGTGGIVFTEFPVPENSSSSPAATAVFVDATNIVAAGTADENFAAARYAIADGTLDPDFGAGGKAEADVVRAIPSTETATGVAVQPDGKTVVVGPTDAGATVQTKGDLEFGVARYNADGTRDATFGFGGLDGNGLVTTNFATNLNGRGTDDSPAGVALQSDGKIVVAGTSGSGEGSADNDFAVARYNADGTLDESFGVGGADGNGKLTTDFGGANGDTGSGVAIQGDPGSAGFRIVVAGTEHVINQSTAFAVAAYTDDGTPDATFDDDGKQTTDLVSVAPASGVTIQPDGKVLVVGTDSAFSPSVDFALVRYGTDGTPDATFGGGDGIVTTDFAGGVDEGRAVAVEDLGAGEVRIVATGRAAPEDDPLTLDAGVAVYTTDGSLDPTFAPGGPDDDGKLTFDLASSFDALRGVALQADGKIVGSGTVESPDFGLARMTSTGSLDPSFGGDGLVSTSFGSPGQNVAAGVALSPSGRIVSAGGRLIAQNGSDFFVARYASVNTPVTPPPGTTPPTTPQTSAPPATAPAKKKKCKKKKKHRAASVAKKKCKKKKP
jgi:uncharacterized delta-60 repeat protein